MKYIEKLIPITDNALLQFKSHSDELKEWSEKGIKYIRYVVDKNEPEMPIHFSGTSMKEFNKGKMLYNDLYEKIIDKTDSNITILKSLYNRVPETELLHVINHPVTPNDNYFKTLLSESNGYLIYKYQLEAFIEDKMGYSREEAVMLRQGWNKKVIRDREVIMTDEHYYLIENKMIFYFVFSKM